MHLHLAPRLRVRGHLLGVGVALLSACSSTTSSTNLDTAGFHVTYVVVSYPPEPIRAVAVFRVGDESGSYLEIVGGDGIAVDGSALRPVDSFSPSDDLAAPSWIGLRYEGELGPGPEHVFLFTRDGEPPVTRSITEVGAPAPTVDGLSTATRSFAAPVAVSWTPVADSTVSVFAVSADTVNCHSLSLVSDLADVGTYSLDTARLRPADSTAACSFRVTVVRTREEPIGAPFRGGALRAIASGSMELTLR
jgi:hypothetical protein